MLKRGLESRLNSAWICDSHQLLQRSPAATVTELPPPCRDPVCVRVCYVTNLDASHVTLNLLKNMSQVFFSFLILYINGGIKGAVWIFMRITVCRLSIKRPGSWYLHLYKDLTWQAPVIFRQFKWTAECCQPSRLFFFNFCEPSKSSVLTRCSRVRGLLHFNCFIDTLSRFFTALNYGSH